MDRLNALFDRLDSWRHLPSYQLERRADIFVALYLPDIIKHKFEVAATWIVPEFPIRIGEIYGDGSINKSFKIDYLVLTERPNHAVFVELKTDSASRRGKQDWYLKKAKTAGLRTLIDGLIKICDATKSPQKYARLMKLMEQVELVKISGGVYENITTDGWAVDILYIQPGEGGDDVVTLSEVAKIVAAYQDELSQRFAKSLREWDTVRAGSV